MHRTLQLPALGSANPQHKETTSDSPIRVTELTHTHSAGTEVDNTTNTQQSHTPHLYTAQTRRLTTPHNHSQQSKATKPHTRNQRESERLTTP